jgi:hypothetical protein
VKRGDAARDSGVPPKSKIISPGPTGRPSLDVSFPANHLACGLYPECLQKIRLAPCPGDQLVQPGGIEP